MTKGPNRTHRNGVAMRRTRSVSMHCVRPGSAANDRVRLPEWPTPSSLLPSYRRIPEGTKIYLFIPRGITVTKPVRQSLITVSTLEHRLHIYL